MKNEFTPETTTKRKPKPVAKKGVQILIEDKNIAFLIEEGCRLDSAKKAIESSLTGIKSELEVLDPGKYITDEGSTVNISTSPKYSAIDPSEAKIALRAKRLGKNFMACVSVSISALKRHLSDDELDELRTVEGTTRKHSFK